MGIPDQDKQEFHFVPQRGSGDDSGPRIGTQENPNSKVHERSRQNDNTAALSDVSKVTLSTNDRSNWIADNGRNTRKARNVSNACTERYVYQIIYNRVFRIPICKVGCKPKYMTVNFANGKTQAIRYDCYK